MRAFLVGMEDALADGRGASPNAGPPTIATLANAPGNDNLLYRIFVS
jgi:hypothetical protein